MGIHLVDKHLEDVPRTRKVGSIELVANVPSEKSILQTQHRKMRMHECKRVNQHVGRTKTLAVDEMDGSPDRSIFSALLHDCVEECKGEEQQLPRLCVLTLVVELQDSHSQRPTEQVHKTALIDRSIKQTNRWTDRYMTISR
jgi:hypothetical protein